jgi:KipI family sensor histidine kinase inhibitor
VLRIAARAHRQWPHATVVPGLASVLVAFERPSDRPGHLGVDGLRALPRDGGASGGSVTPVAAQHARAGGTPAATAAAARLHSIPTSYDGPDLADVAAMLGRPAVEVVRRHTAAIWTVAAIGFSPGFGYLTTTDPLFAGIGRRSDPRARIPRGSVALAAHMCAVYPSATPGGWQLIGSSAADLFDVHAEHPALMRVGDSVEFVVL